MPGILESMFAGAAVGGGAAMEDVYRRRDQASLESQLAEQRAKADQDRQVALERLRQSGAVDLQTRSNTFTAGENSLNRSATSSEKKLDRDLTGQHYSILEQQNKSASERDDRRMTETERHNKEIEKIYKGRDQAKADNAYERLPEQAKLQLNDLSKEASSLRTELRKARADATKLENRIDPNAATASQAYIKEIESGMQDIARRRAQVEIQHGLISPEDVVGVRGGKFKSLDEINSFLKAQESIGGQSWSNKVADALEAAGIPQKLTKATDKPAETPKSAPDLRGAAPTGVIGAAVSAPPTGGVRVGRAGQGSVGGDTPPVSAPQVKGLSTQEIMQMDVPSVQRLLANRSLLTYAQLKAATDRLRQGR